MRYKVGPPPPTAQPAFEYNDGKGGTCMEPQHKHRQIKDGEYKHEMLKFGEDKVPKPGELKYEPACSNGVHEPPEGEDNGIREHEDDTPHPAPSTTAGPAVN